MSCVEFRLDGRTLQAEAGDTLWQAAARAGIEIPHLCHKDGIAPAGNCRACVVEVEGERTLAASCCRAVAPGMVVRSDSERARASQRLVLELLKSDVAESASGTRTPRDELQLWSERLGVGASRFPARPRGAPDASHPAIAVDLDACIQCTRCLRACRDLQANDVIGLAGRGAQAQIVFDMADPMGASSCVACGECVQACPTGALAPATPAYIQPVDRSVESVCPYCGVGCQLTYHVQGDRIAWVEGRPGPANQGRLCVKGRYGFDYVHHPHRLRVPLIRREGVPKDPAARLDPADWASVFREATW
ncbi:MAG: (2Fe-2S)-binding protein, partial [Rubrivivax sp.]|nr:(2Fe-2S)-binding protein [Rubrivivax sp.]